MKNATSYRLLLGFEDPRQVVDHRTRLAQLGFTDFPAAPLGRKALSTISGAQRVWADRVVLAVAANRGNKIVHWSAFDTGGHLAAMDSSDLLVGDVRTIFRGLR